MTVALGDEAPLGRLQSLASERLLAHVAFREAVADAGRGLDESLTRIKQEEEMLRRLTGDLKVLIRWSQGPEVLVYHSATHPCGRVTGKHRDLKRFRGTTEGFARTQGLRRCSACRWWLAENNKDET